MDYVLILDSFLRAFILLSSIICLYFLVANISKFIFALKQARLQNNEEWKDLK